MLLQTQMPFRLLYHRFLLKQSNIERLPARVPQRSARPERPAKPPHPTIPSAGLPFSKRSYKTCGPDIAEIPVFREFPRFSGICLSQAKNFYTIFSLSALLRTKIPFPAPGPQKSSPLILLARAHVPLGHRRANLSSGVLAKIRRTRFPVPALRRPGHRRPVC